MRGVRESKALALAALVRAAEVLAAAFAGQGQIYGPCVVDHLVHRNKCLNAWTSGAVVAHHSDTPHM